MGLGHAVLLEDGLTVVKWRHLRQFKTWPHGLQEQVL